MTLQRGLIQIVLTLAAVTLYQWSCGRADVDANGVRYELTRGVLGAADHELAEGSFTVGVAKGLTVIVVPRSMPWQRLKELRGTEVRIVVEPLP